MKPTQSNKQSSGLTSAFISCWYLNMSGTCWFSATEHRSSKMRRKWVTLDNRVYSPYPGQNLTPTPQNPFHTGQKMLSAVGKGTIAIPSQVKGLWSSHGYLLAPAPISSDKNMTPGWTCQLSVLFRHDEVEVWDKQQQEPSWHCPRLPCCFPLLHIYIDAFIPSLGIAPKNCNNEEPLLWHWGALWPFITNTFYTDCSMWACCASNGGVNVVRPLGWQRR